MSQHQRIFITGGASGLGRALALRHAREGWRVCIADLNDERGETVRRELVAAGAAEAVYHHADVTREEDLQAVADDLAAR
ncbi:SDR family NAD(P)-dependent oxidoreductase, partial [Acinetobacter baumannii]